MSSAGTVSSTGAASSAATVSSAAGTASGGGPAGSSAGSPTHQRKAGTVRPVAVSATATRVPGCGRGRGSSSSRRTVRLSTARACASTGGVVSGSVRASSSAAVPSGACSRKVALS